jgi:leucyl aminopeptidase (aminopeptidase T)
MFPIEQINIIKLVINNSLAIKPGEKVLIIADEDENVEIASVLAAEAKSVGAEVAITIIDPRRGLHREPPVFVAESMKHADVIIGVIYSLLHTQAIRDAQSAGARFATMGGARLGKGKEYLASLEFDVNDLNLIEKRTTLLAEQVTQARIARLTCDKGSNLTMSLLNRKGLAVMPICRDPGVFCILVDYSEVACPPVQESAEGSLVIDGTVWGLPGLNRVVREPIRLKINRGKIVDISGGKDAGDLQAVLANVDSNGKSVAELGIGTNHKVEKLRGVTRDKANSGTIHIGFGKSEFIGGSLDSEIHIDLMVTKPTLELDGVLIIDKGKFI